MNGFGALEALARAGFLVKGVLYMIVGVLALQLAFGAGGRVTGTRGALVTLLRQPYGRTLLLGAAVGLVAYGIWRVLQGLLDPDRAGHGWKGLALRATFVIRGVIHTVLGWQAFRLHRGLSTTAATSERAVASQAFQWPLGDWLVLLAGLGLIGFAAHQFWAAAQCRLEPNLEIGRMRREAGEWAVNVSRFGIAARALAFGLLGWTVAVAGWSRDAAAVGSTTSLLLMVAEQPGAAGRWLLALTAAGFVSYGFYEMVHARYLHIRRLG